MEAFPSCERKPFGLIIRKFIKKQTDVWVIESDNTFVGLAITVNGSDMILLDYFAISNDLRGSGYGSKALKMLQRIYRDRRFFLEIETVHADRTNEPECLRIKAFYLRNGMNETGIQVHLFGVGMELLTYKCSLTFEEYYGLYYQNFGKRVQNNVLLISDERNIPQ